MRLRIVKGIVFVEFSNFIEDVFSEEVWDELLTLADLPSEGVYTTVGTYDDQELFTLIDLACKKSGLTEKAAQEAFGKWVFKKLYNAAPPEAHTFTDVFSFLHAVQDVIHIEVKKLNPDAILPEFEFIAETDDHLSLIYKSPRHLCYFCEGLIHGLAQHTGQEVKVSQSECVHDSGHRCVIEVSKL